MITDPDTNEEFPDPDQPPDYLAGINKLLKAWEDMNGRTALDKRGELRQSFYMDLARKPTERVSEFCTRFRSLVADLKGEGVTIADSELGWWLRQKLGLDPLRHDHSANVSDKALWWSSKQCCFYFISYVFGVLLVETFHSDSEVCGE